MKHNAQDEPRPGVALDPPVGRLVNEDKEATMDEILVCPECGSDQVTVTAEQSFMVNTGEHYCHSVKTYDDEAKARCLACQWTGHRGALVEDSKTPNVGIQRAGTAPME